MVPLIRRTDLVNPIKCPIVRRLVDGFLSLTPLLVRGFKAKRDVVVVTMPALQCPVVVTPALQCPVAEARVEAVGPGTRSASLTTATTDLAKPAVVAGHVVVVVAVVDLPAVGVAVVVAEVGPVVGRRPVTRMTPGWTTTIGTSADGVAAVAAG